MPKTMALTNLQRKGLQIDRILSIVVEVVLHVGTVLRGIQLIRPLSRIVSVGAILEVTFIIIICLIHNLKI